MRKYTLTLSVLLLVILSIGFLGFNAHVTHATLNSAEEKSLQDLSTFNSLNKSSLRIGSRGNSVSALQQFLKDKGYSVVGRVDGKYGPKTYNAVVAFMNNNQNATTVVSTPVVSTPASSIPVIIVPVKTPITTVDTVPSTNPVIISSVSP